MQRIRHWWHVVSAGYRAPPAIASVIILFVGGSVLLFFHWGRTHLLWGVAVLLVAIVVVVLEGSYQETRRLVKDQKRDVATLRTTHRAELAEARLEHQTELNSTLRASVIAPSLPLSITVIDKAWISFRDAGYTCAALLRIENTSGQHVIVVHHAFQWFWSGNPTREGAAPEADRQALMEQPRALRESGNYEPPLPIRNVTVPPKDCVTGWAMSAASSYRRPRCVITVKDALGNSYTLYVQVDDQDWPLV